MYVAVADEFSTAVLSAIRARRTVVTEVTPQRGGRAWVAIHGAKQIGVAGSELKSSVGFRVVLTEYPLLDDFTYGDGEELASEFASDEQALAVTVAQLGARPQDFSLRLEDDYPGPVR
jgi:hypothetical protein